VTLKFLYHGSNNKCIGCKLHKPLNKNAEFCFNNVESLVLSEIIGPVQLSWCKAREWFGGEHEQQCQQDKPDKAILFRQTVE